MKRKKAGLIALMVLMIACTMVFGITACGASVSGTYYMYDGEHLDKSSYIKLDGSEWSDEIMTGTYKISGDTITLYTDLFGENVEFTSGTIKDGVLTINTMGMKVTYYKDGKAPADNDGKDNSPVKEYTVIFDSNGGQFEEGNTKQTVKKLKNGAFIEPIANPIRDGSYEFSGWAKDKNGEELWNFDSDTVTSDLTLYAVWSKTLDFKLSKDGTCYAVGGIGGLSGDVEIPETHNNKPVTAILQEAFGGCYNLTSITIPNSVKSIGDHAFRGCYNLTSITIPDSVTNIGYNAFYNCSSLTSITIPDSVTSIAAEAFMSCSSLTSVTIGNGVTSIGGHTFYDCNSLTSVTIGNGVTSIGSYAFDCCHLLTSITIPDSVTSIGDYAFYCSASIYYMGDIKGWCEMKRLSSLMSENCKLYIGGNEIKGELLIPDGVTSIGDYAFSGCSSLTSVTIPDSVTSIGSYAFEDCSSLTSVTIPDSVTSIGSYAFEDCPIENATIPTIACYDINNSNLKTVVITSGDSIEKNAFYGCSSLTSITIPDGVTSIGYSAFKDCSSLTSITIPDSVTWIEDSAFSGCSKLIQIENGVQYVNSFVVGFTDHRYSVILRKGTKGIADHAFFECGSTNITIPDSMTWIGWEAFFDCRSLTSITIPNSVKNIGENAFSGCPIVVATIPTLAIPYIPKTNLSTVVITSGESIGDSAFSGCSSLTSITIPDNVKSIGSGAFSDCYDLTSVTIGNGVTSIEDMTFENCGSLTSVTIPDSVTSIGKDAFSGCYNLTSITVPDSVTSIGDEAFYGCKLTSVTIGNGVTSIGDEAFLGCHNLTRITFKGTKAQWNSIRKGTDWNNYTGKYTVHCTDGDIPKY